MSEPAVLGDAGVASNTKRERTKAQNRAGAMAGAALELGVRMADRCPPDLDGAARFATELFLGGISRLGSR